jgi:hypothetical protein
MEYNDKRKREVLRQELNGKKRAIENINNLLNSDKLTCEIKGFNNMSFYVPSVHMSIRKDLISKILLKDKELLEIDITQIEKQFEELK